MVNRHSAFTPDPVTVGSALRAIKQYLTEAGCQSPAFDAACICTQITGFTRAGMVTHGDDTIADESWQRLLDMAKQRASGMPLQYLLGQWDFMGLPFFVGEGVLIPRSETELLCETVIDFIQERSSPRVLDLCAGSGAIAIGIQKFVPQAEVTAVEKSHEALNYLRKNAAHNDADINIREADILQEPLFLEGAQFDVIVSNPPYIQTAALAGLQREVQFEPKMALDGGEDGLLFYRAILKHWMGALAKDGMLAVECGQGQGREIATLFEKAGLAPVSVICDINGVDRVVLGMKGICSQENRKY